MLENLFKKSIPYVAAFVLMASSGCESKPPFYKKGNSISVNGRIVEVTEANAKRNFLVQSNDLYFHFSTTDEKKFTDLFKGDSIELTGKSGFFCDEDSIFNMRYEKGKYVERNVFNDLFQAFGLMKYRPRIIDVLSASAYKEGQDSVRNSL